MASFPRNSFCAALLLPLSLVGGSHAAAQQAAAQQAAPQQATAEQAAPTGQLVSRQALAVDRLHHKLYAVDVAAASVWVVDTTTQSPAEVKVGKGPIAVEVNPTIGKAYVLNTDDGTVSVVDGATHAVVRTVSVGARPYSLVIDPASGRVVVSNVYSDLLTVIDPVSYRTTQRKMGSFDAMAVNAKTGTLYLMGYEGSNLIALVGPNGAPRKIAAGAMHLWGLAVDDTKNIVYVTHIQSNDLAVIDEAAHTLKTVPTGALPAAVAVNPVTNTLYVANYGDDSVTVIDGAKLIATAKVSVGLQPHAVVVDATTGRIYVANTHGDSVTIVDGHTNSVLGTLPAGKNPYALALDPQTGSLYVSNEGEPAYTYLDVRKVH